MHLAFDLFRFAILVSGGSFLLDNDNDSRKAEKRPRKGKMSLAQRICAHMHWPVIVIVCEKRERERERERAPSLTHLCGDMASRFIR